MPDYYSSKWVVLLISLVVALVIHGLYMMLRLSGGSFPKPLNREEEQQALERSAGGDISARNLLIERNMRLVAHVVKKYYSNVSDQDDLISIGTIGLIKAIESFDYSKGTKLATYAGRCIENEIRMHFRGVKRRPSEVSLDEPFDNDGNGEGNGPTYLSVLSIEDENLEIVENEEIYNRIRSLVDIVLDPREKRIIVRRFGLDGKLPQAQREIAAKEGISRSYVSRIEKRALSKLEKATKDEKPT